MDEKDFVAPKGRFHDAYITSRPMKEWHDIDSYVCKLLENNPGLSENANNAEIQQKGIIQQQRTIVSAINLVTEEIDELASRKRQRDLSNGNDISNDDDDDDDDELSNEDATYASIPPRKVRICSPSPIGDEPKLNVTDENSSSDLEIVPVNLNNKLQDSIYDIKDAIVDDGRAVDESEEFNTEKAGEVNSSNYSEKAKSSNVSFDEYIDSAVSVEDEEIKFDLNNISIELQHEPAVKWEVGDINVTDRFRNYQKDVLRKAEREGLDYENIYESL
ncbi:hypothetical protein C1646_822025 [Rhizophagus diaphanus]|nr:hypothetical protein C1646_822025 [Rhizophagus diaphanus] [Rhizophagus sp. MUCL 43196]